MDICTAAQPRNKCKGTKLMLRQCTNCGAYFTTRKTRRKVYCSACREKLHNVLVKRFICQRKGRNHDN